MSNPFLDPVVAGLYDVFEGERPDLDVYAAVVDEFGAGSVLDMGCGTGTFACLLADRGIRVIGIDPSEPCLDVARRKPGAEQVRWINVDAAGTPPFAVDMVTMTGNVAQVFLTDESWRAALCAAWAVLRPGGHLVFETRDPSREAWKEWTPDRSRTEVDIADQPRLETWEEVVSVDLPLVTFRSTILSGGNAVVTESTLRFRTRDDVAASLQRCGFDVIDVRDAPDRPGREFVFIAEKPAAGESLSSRHRVRRDGGTIVRSGRPWSGSVIAFLRYLETVGFDGAPRVIGDGFDTDGNETLSYIEGEPVHPGAWDDDGIAALGQLLRRFHDLSAGFSPPPDAIWQPWFTRSTEPDAVIGHGDLGPWNIIARDGVPVGFIDWEFAGPVDRLSEVAQAAWLNAQLHADDVAGRNRLPTAARRAHQLALFVDGYGLASPERSRLVSRMIDLAVRDATNELDQSGGLRIAKRPSFDDPDWAIAWRLRSAAWLVDHRPLLEASVA